jgi:hypothetical protein
MQLKMTNMHVNCNIIQETFPYGICLTALAAMHIDSYAPSLE